MNFNTIENLLGPGKAIAKDYDGNVVATSDDRITWTIVKKEGKSKDKNEVTLEINIP